MMRAVLAPLVGTAVGLVVGALIIAASGADPLAAYAALARGALGGPRPLTETVLKATPLVIMGLGLVVAFRCRIWNIGGEGQYFAGALAGASVALLGQASLPAWLLIPLMLLAGIAGGALWAALATWLRLAFGVNEIIATIMLNFVALYTVSYLARGPLRDPMGYLPQSARLETVARLPTLPGSRIHLGVLIALLLVPAIYLLLWKTTWGFRLRAIGSSARVALATGIDVKAGVALAFLTSGALAGLAGIIEVSALHTRLKDGISGDYGFTGILVALLGRLHPVGVLLAGVFFAILTIGTQSMHSGLGLPIALSQVLQVVVILVVLVADALARRWWPGG
jgi:simple sugar transport system permease protein